LVITFAGGASKISFSRINVDTSGRANLVSGGVDLFAKRPLWGYGSGSFQAAYKDQAANQNAPVSVSHTEPVTVGAEQGLAGLLLYAALLVAALWVMGAGMWAPAPARGPPVTYVARAAVLATFVALLVHTMAYAGFFEDPITWVLLALAVSLAGRIGAPDEVGPAVSRDPAPTGLL
jgi:O-antigen ligase